MTDANQIRINELARDLEVKAKAIIDYLPEAGVTEKKTHSSSIELAAAEKVREHFRELADERSCRRGQAESGKERQRSRRKSSTLKADGVPAPATVTAPAVAAPAAAAAAEPAPHQLS